MTPPPLCIIQCRYNSTRLPAKVLLKLEGRTLVQHAWNTACTAFGADNCVVAIPATDEAGPLGKHLRAIRANVFAYEGEEADVLGRFHACAHAYRWHPETVIVRHTPDDFRKHPKMMWRVAQGERLPVEQGGEAFTLAMLDAAHASCTDQREHITYALFPTLPPKAPDDGLPWSIDTIEQYDAVVARVGK